MIRAVVDANVWISAALARSDLAPSVQVFEAMCDSRLQAITCPTLIGEVSSTLASDRLRRRVPEDRAQRFVSDLLALTPLVVDPAEPYPAICRDPNDDYLLALASATGAEVLVTGDRDLLELEASPVPVLTPRAAIERLDALD